MTTAYENLRLAIPRGRILEELLPLMAGSGIKPEPAFFDKHERKLEFASNIQNLSILRVRSFDIATFVAFGVAQIGIAGRDVLMEFDFPEVYAPLDLGIGACRMVVAQSRELHEKDNPRRWRPCPGGHQISGNHPPSLRGPRCASRMRETEWCDGNRPVVGSLPADRRSGVYGIHVGGKRTGRSRGDRQDHFASCRKPCGD